MGRTVTLGNGKDINKDIELCYTINERISDYCVRALIENHIPFTKNLVNIPFFLRERFHGAKQMYVISTNYNLYSQARRTIDQLDPIYKRRLRLSNY